MTPISETPPFTLTEYSRSQRIQIITLNNEIITAFNQQTTQWNVQAIEFTPFLRFMLATILDNICENQLGYCLKNIITSRNKGAFLLQFEQQENQSVDCYIKLSTAISHLIGLPNFDAMSGKFYARFIINHTDNDDSYLRKAYHPLTLHNDGTYVDENTDFVLMMKIGEQDAIGGDSTLLHIDDWQALKHFYHHKIAKTPFQWQSPPSKQVQHNVFHPVFIDEDKHGKPQLSFIDQFAYPQNKEQALFLYQLQISLEQDENILSLTLPVGSILVIHNHYWLHGRDAFTPHIALTRELLRQRGRFFN
ncbi:glutarate dioxygenase GlaH [Shewanella surugensis]|uniref:Carbon starvation induced protein CsiD n=1 Tax=Shewanella surugensis TaxID=212020 RepID=A0ABT0LB93_9GAMM|nr:glutarate dioxygenase GlaH [Shewanella surugensis]MCL1124942.1 carbon starvation induced protein CsiD [Shewanella surugensis]